MIQECRESTKSDLIWILNEDNFTLRKNCPGTSKMNLQAYSALINISVHFIYLCRYMGFTQIGLLFKGD